MISADPLPGVAEELEPRGVFLSAPGGGGPALLDGAEDALGVGHHDGHAAGGGREGGHAVRATVRV